MKDILTIILGVIIIGALGFGAFRFLDTGFDLLNRGMKRFERHECSQWLQDSSLFEDWFSTQWQVDQCSQYDIDLTSYLYE